ncbi:uncharacterized protein LOC117326688 [Pecten maximus]|uniref:uncharacterized protein LOC117326688 n=1 Tax=Pecten maximus TaxID=6579 RepID=UPI001458B2C6|nr:uncharacterized protein LOC117326688 [Pecten maximus]
MGRVFSTRQFRKGDFLIFVNDGVGRQRNSVMVLETFNDHPYLCLYASRDIFTGEEIRYDYGVQNLPWRHNVNVISGHLKLHALCELISRRG